MGSVSNKDHTPPLIASPLLSDTEAHKLIAPSLCYRTWVQMRHDGKIPFLKVGRRVLINVEKARDAIEANFTVDSAK